MSEDQVLVDRVGAVTHIRLNRPRAINALNLDMVERLIEAFRTAWNDGSQAILLEGEGERGLCGGGDIKAMAHDNASGAARFVEREYVLDLMTHESPIPVVGIMDGITMGGGIGLTGHAAIRVVTERSQLAMPEVRIGIVPDVGGHLLLARAPGRLGEFLALSAETFGAGDALALGFADVCVDAARLPELRSALLSADDSGFDARRIVGGFTTPPPPAEVLLQREWVDPLFESVLGGAEGVDLALVQEPGAGAFATWAIQALKRLVHVAEHSGQSEKEAFAGILRQMAPVSLAVTLAQIARTRALGLELEEVLRDDLRILTRMFNRPDFVEGVRARVIDKDQTPSWTPKRIEDLDAVIVAQILDPVD